ncbi:MAG: acVLRF1 family peptidyl-tRNA hydrolase [Nocardioides sp.]|uniref:acVLRF1 family peptidyl-tRNA hydrolase n=1 Tax=Nocardioides sp. TaxID=35761 RepID=UPI0039E653CB
MAQVSVAPERIIRWMENFEHRHGASRLTVRDGGLRGDAEDGSWFSARLPFDRGYDAQPAAAAFAAAATPPTDWGVLLVRKGGFAVARLRGGTMVEHKVGQRHVQGRSKAGGWSQQRFARRRDHQAREAYQAAADHAARILGGLDGPLVTGGDRGAIRDVLADPRLAPLRPVDRFLTVRDQRRAALDAAVDAAAAVCVEVHNASGSARPTGLSSVE